MKRNTKYWIGMVIFFLFLLFFIASRCHARIVARRHFDSISLGSVGGGSGYANSRPEGDLWLDHWAMFNISGEPVEIGNIKIDYEIYFTDGTITGFPVKRGTIRTNKEGRSIITVACPGPTEGAFWYDYTILVSGPNISRDSGGKFQQYPSPEHPKPEYREWTETSMGRYWGSGSAIGDGTYRPKSKNNSSSSPIVSMQAAAFLAGEPNETHQIVAGSQWTIHVEKETGTQAIAADYFYPIDDLRNDPNFESLMSENTTPYVEEFYFWTTLPTAMVETKIDAQLYIGDPNEPNYVEQIELCVVADSNDLRSHVAVSPSIVVAEPNGFGPFYCGDYLIVPASEGQTLRVGIDNYMQFIFFAFSSWLDNNPDFDLNHDGIVNFGDWP